MIPKEKEKKTNLWWWLLPVLRPGMGGKGDRWQLNRLNLRSHTRGYSYS